MAIRVKIDEDLPKQIAELFAQYGYEATTVVEQGWQGLPDELLWPRVQQEGRLLVTADKGFADLRTRPPGSHSRDSPSSSRRGKPSRLSRIGSDSSSTIGDRWTRWRCDCRVYPWYSHPQTLISAQVENVST